ncbi:MAG: hypothetical protein JSU74_00990 [Candidatus Zixiibacteriota bacterium]|nr:MAG: hypothetical protein JSU74_00990 [candidate division Zixibacteria bacterium]
MMISTTQMLYCLVAGGIYLLLVTVFLEFISRKLKFLEGMPPSILEESGGIWLILFFIMEFLFFVAIPTVTYSFFYLIVPFYGIRAGLAATLFAFTLGAVPIIMCLTVRLKLPMPYLLFVLLGYLVKLGGSMTVIGYLYTL